MEILFFMGKGGAGKSTLSTLAALSKAHKGKHVLLASLDPAHNLSDIFEREFSDKAKSVTDFLSVIEINQDKWIKEYLKNVELQFSKSYAYLTTFNLDKHFSVLRYAPGIEEYALVMACKSIVDKFKHFDYLLFDMPPTALALKFFALPQISLLWLEKLQAMRQEINSKQKIISTLKLGKKEIQRDRVLQNIEQQAAFWQSVLLIFNQMKLVLVENPDVLSNAEGKRITKRLAELDLPKPIKMINKAAENAIFDQQELVIPILKKNTGLENLQNEIKNLDLAFL